MLIDYLEYMSVCHMSFVLDLIFTVHYLWSSFHAKVYLSFTISGRSTLLDVLIDYYQYISVCHMSFVLDLNFMVHLLGSGFHA